MKIAFIGLGKLGFPCAVALAMRGHDVYGFDTNAELMDGYRRGEVTPYEPDLDVQYAKCRDRLHLCESLADAYLSADYVFVAVPTPHAPTHDGSHPYDGVPRDFDNSAITKCLKDIAITNCSLGDGRHRTILVISTVTPGSMHSLGAAMTGMIGGSLWNISLIYNPFFIGQSTVVQDFLNPEFVLLGCHPSDDSGAQAAERLYAALHDAPIRRMTYVEAELTKLCYNTYLGLKVLFANSVMELCHHLEADCDVVNGTLKLAKDRLVSTKYMDGGMADGGPCHGRDQMAMSWVANQAGLSFDIFDAINRGRDAQTEWLASLIARLRGGRSLQILGMAFKPGTNQTQGSPAMLLANIIKRDDQIEFTMDDPAVQPNTPPPDRPALFFVATPWPEYAGFKGAAGDIIIDPWGIVGPQPPGVQLVRVGRGRRLDFA